MKLPEIVGVAGTNASGKDTLGALRARLQHAKFVSLSDILRHELDIRGLTHERENLRGLSAEWKAEGGSGVLVDKTIALYESEKEPEGYNGLTMTSIRTIGEVEAIKAAGGVLIWVDADRDIRYARSQARNQGRPEDQKTFEQFCAEEDAEMYPPKGQENDKAVLNMATVKEMADITILNEFASHEAYEEYLKTEFELGSN